MRIGWLLLLLASAMAWAQPTPIRTVTSLPATCKGGTAGISTDTVVLVSGGVGQQYTCSAPNTWTATGTSFPITSPETISTGGSISPTGIGQDAANQMWLPAGLGSGVSNVIGLSVTVNPTGGSLTSAQTYIVAWFNSAAGSTYPSYQAAPSMSACGAAVCSITVSIPQPIPNGMTTWTVGSSPSSGSGYLANSACTALPVATTTCTITALSSGAAAPILNTAFLQPPNVQTNECPLGVIPSIFTQDMSGNYHTAGGVDLNSNNGITSGFLMFCRHMRFDDQQLEPPYGNNAAWMFNHMAGVGISTANQDRNVWMNTQTPTGDSASRYGVENLQAETDFNCNGCAITGSPDGDVEVISAQLSDNMQTNPNPAGGIQVARFNYDRTTTATAYFSPSVTVNSTWGPGSATGFSGGSQGIVYLAQCSNSSGNIPNLVCYGYNFYGPANADHFNNGTIAFAWSKTIGFTPTLGYDFFMLNEIIGAGSQMNGPVTLSQVVNNYSNTTLPITGSTVTTASTTVTQGTMPAPSSVTCSGGASTYGYQFVGVDNNGGQVSSVVTNSASSCANPLTSGNPASIFINATPAQIVQFVRIDVYRTAGPMATGKVGSLTCGASVYGGATCNTFSDTGLSASGTLPTINTTGSSQAYKVQTTTNCAAIGSAASPSLVACGSASAGSFSCATNASTATCVISTTAVTALSEIIVSQTSAKGTQIGVTCNTTADVPTGPRVASQSAGVSFTINLGTVAVNPTCYDYFIVN
jgi:hypothetical protein